MALFERNYKAAATAELERSVRDLEERDKTSETKPAFQKDASETQSNLNFSERLELVSATQADALRERVKKAEQDFAKLQRTQTMDVVNDFENPLERGRRYQSMENYNAEIAREKAKTATGQEQPSPSPPVRSGDERVR